MDFLTLCNRVRQEAGIAGDGPSSVLTQTGQLGRIVNWTAQAWTDIQLMRPDWNFMWKEFTFDTVAATRDYLASDYSITDLKLWDTGSFLIYETSVGASDQNALEYLKYGAWRNRYRVGMTARDDNRPTLFTILPDNKVRFESQPDKAYTIEGEYKRTSQTFAADTDVPTSFPDDFHMMIVWRAMIYYAHYEDAPEVMDEAETKFGDLLFRLEQEQLPAFSDDFETLA